jgi:hypothetical protein
MKSNIRNTTREVMIFVTLGSLIGFAWHSFYIKPHDKARMEVIECMEENRDMSHSSYNSCIEKLKP